MRRTLIADNSRAGFGQVLLAVLLGATAGLFISGYWLIDLFPVDSRLLMGLSALAGVAAGTAYYASIPRISSVWRRLSMPTALVGVLVGVLLACFLFFAGTSQWQEPARYVGFFLPYQRFNLTSAGAQPGTSIVWINTSFGDVSYDTLRYWGWVRRGDQMVLQDPLHNSMEWSGRAGERIEIVFANGSTGGDFQIQWADLVETIHLGSDKASYQRMFPVPFVASRVFVLALGFLHFWLLSVIALWAAGAARRRANQPAAEADSTPGLRQTLWRELPLLGAIMGLALLLRAFNLGGVFPAVDEYYHLIAADQLLSGASLGSVYPRGLWIVTIPVAAALKVLGHEISAARSMGVVFNIIAVIPLYALVRRVGKPAAIAAGLLYATSPWIIAFARVAREYAYYPLYFYGISLAMVGFVEAIPSGFVAPRQWRQLLRPGVVLLALGLIVPPVFALKIDWLSTFRTILIAYLVFGAFILGRFDWRSRANWPILGAVAITLAASGWYFYREQATKLLLLPRVQSGAPAVLLSESTSAMVLRPCGTCDDNRGRDRCAIGVCQSSLCRCSVVLRLPVWRLPGGFRALLKIVFSHEAPHIHAILVCGACRHRPRLVVGLAPTCGALEGQGGGDGGRTGACGADPEPNSDPPSHVVQGSGYADYRGLSARYDVRPGLYEGSCPRRRCTHLDRVWLIRILGGRAEVRRAVPDQFRHNPRGNRGDRPGAGNGLDRDG